MIVRMICRAVVFRGGCSFGARGWGSLLEMGSARNSTSSISEREGLE